MKKFVEIIKMDYNIIISIEAQIDTNDAYCYYEGQQTGLGERFLNELSHFYKKLEQHPEYYSFTSEIKTTRSVALKIFPYKIIYEIEGDEIFVFAVYHFRNNPDELTKRF
jgi:mRNA-degrading endonuclease RelE of RelBE toxin-antitoxin system